MKKTAVAAVALSLMMGAAGTAHAGTKASDGAIAKYAASSYGRFLDKQGGKPSMPPGIAKALEHANWHSAGAPGHDYEHHAHHDKSRGC